MSRTISALHRLLVLAGAIAVLVGCAAPRSYTEGQELLLHGQNEAAMARLQAAMQSDPRNIEYRLAFLTARDRVTRDLIDQAQRATARNDIPEAVRLYQRVLDFDFNNSRAREGLASIERDRRHAEVVKEAEQALARNDMEGVAIRVRQVLTENPDNAAARALQRRIGDDAPRTGTPPQLTAALRRLVTIEFKEAPVRQVFEVLSRMSGLNFVFDRDVRTDLRSTIFLRNSTVEAVINLLLLTNQLEQRVVDANTIIIYPNTPAKVREYQQLVVRSFLLATADAKVVANTIRTIVKSRDVIIDEKLNMVIVRDSPEAIRLAERLIFLHDAPEPEVMLEVEVLEVKRSRLLELGITWPGQATFTPLPSVTTDGTTGQLTVRDLRNMNSSTIGVTIDPLTVQARQQVADSNLLANPRIRVRNREKARVLIGDRLPTITSTSTATGFVAETITYIDAGLKLEVEPNIFPDGEVAIKIALEVSNIADRITTRSGTIAYQLGTRSAQTVLRLKDGENQVLAGLIQDTDRVSGNKVPGLGTIPVVGRLFGGQADENAKTEIVLSITPRLVRNVQRPDASMALFEAGTEASLRNRAGGGGEGGGGLFTPRPETPPTPGGTQQQQPRTPTDPNVTQPLPGMPSGTTDPTTGTGTPVTPVTGPGSILGNAIMLWQGPSVARAGTPFAAQLLMQSETPIVSLPVVIGFDPKVIEVVSVTEGDFMRQNGASTTFSSKVDQANGQIVINITRQGQTGATALSSVVTLNLRGITAIDVTRLVTDNVTAGGTGGTSVTVQTAQPYTLRISP
jgi:general secretion pathway protein D